MRVHRATLPPWRCSGSRPRSCAPRRWREHPGRLAGDPSLHTRAGQNDWRLLIPFVVASRARCLRRRADPPPSRSLSSSGRSYPPVLRVSPCPHSQARGVQGCCSPTSSSRRRTRLRRCPRAALRSDRDGRRYIPEPHAPIHGMGGHSPGACVAAGFILHTSIAGLLGTTVSIAALPTAPPIWAGAGSPGP